MGAIDTQPLEGAEKAVKSRWFFRGRRAAKSTEEELLRSLRDALRAARQGDFSARLPAEGRSGLAGEVVLAFNALMTQNEALVGELDRVSSRISGEGAIDTRAALGPARGGWKSAVEAVNTLIDSMAWPTMGTTRILESVANGDLSQTMPLHIEGRPVCGDFLRLGNSVNHVVGQLRTVSSRVARVMTAIGNEGKLGVQVSTDGLAGTWKDLIDDVNATNSNLSVQLRNIAQVSTAIANGDLSQKIEVGATGEILELKNTINATVDQLRTFAAEVTRVAREVGTEGKLGGQAQVPGVAGTWQELTDNVNLMATNLTNQVRGISKVVTAVADGDLAQKLVLEARGEIATLADTINNMTDTLRTFAEQVTTMAREVGIEGKLGGQAKVPGAAGTWRDLTDNVNQLAANLTTQVRAISEVATAVTEGDLTRTITVETRGEMLSLKDTINQMIANLRDTTRTNKEQDWLKTNLAKFFSLTQGQRNLESLTRLVMSELTAVVGAQHGAFYLMDLEADRPVLKLTSTYAYTNRKRLNSRFELGEGLVGQCALERKPIVITDAPEDYIEIGSGLGKSVPRTIVVFPVLFEEQVRGVIELASFHELAPIQLNFLEQLMLNIGLAINLIGTSMRTEELLQQLQGSNVELEERRRELEEKAQELSKVSQYKSQFLANMSHEIRTPLNSMMILSQMLAADERKTLNEQQREWAETIHSAGRDLLALINQILDLSKVEAGRIETHFERYPLATVRDFAERTFRPVAMQQDVGFEIELDAKAPEHIGTDRQLLEQILKNLLSNAFKFTEQGKVRLRIARAPKSAGFTSSTLRQAKEVVCFTVTDTGIGVAPDKHALIFEAFQQGDPTITRRYGGTGLGLTISREYARILGGEIAIKSTPGKGSSFMLYLPLQPESAHELPDAAVEAAAGTVLAEVVGDAGKALQQRRILLVEDDPRNLYAMTGLLERAGATVVPAANAQEALDVLKAEEGVDLVLMDIMMPEIDGYEATRQIRAMPRYADLPVIALTAKASSIDQSLCLAAGCTDYVVKPVEIRHLVNVMRRHLTAAVV